MHAMRVSVNNHTDDSTIAIRVCARICGGGSMTNAIRFHVPGIPVAKGRARVTTIGGHARAYTPAKTRDFETAIGLYAQQAMRQSGEPMAVDGEVVRADILVVRAPLKSWSRKIAAVKPNTYAVGSVDLDNQVKAILDGLNTIAFLDDRQVAALTVARIWGDRDRIEIEVEAYPENMEAPNASQAG